MQCNELFSLDGTSISEAATPTLCYNLLITNKGLTTFFLEIQELAGINLFKTRRELKVSPLATRKMDTVNDNLPYTYIISLFGSNCRFKIGAKSFALNVISLSVKQHLKKSHLAQSIKQVLDYSVRENVKGS